MTEFRVVNRAAPPRVLVMLSSVSAERFEFLSSREGTLRKIDSLGEVDPAEWDVIITDDSLVHHSPSSSDPYAWWRREVPLGMHVFFVHRENLSSSTIDLVVTSEKGTKPSFAIQHVGKVPGNEARRVDSLNPDLQKLTQKVLVQLVGSRAYQWGHKPVDLTAEKMAKLDHYVPFLIGASTTVTAGHYMRGMDDSVWLVPEDAPDFEPWWDLAIDSWHQITPDRIPGLPKWQQSGEWMTAEEQLLAEKLSERRAAFADLEREHENAIGALAEDIALATQRADAHERVLLTGQGDALQTAVLSALEDIGFDVEDMDAKWDPRERREDYRIRDEMAPGWMVIGDATGTSGGTPGSKLQTLSTYVNKYLIEEKPDKIPGQWLLSNQFVGRDPKVRSEVLRGDDLRVFASAGGLAIDTAALFKLRKAVIMDESLKLRLRTWLREATGQIRVSDALAWLESET